ncbi:MAG: acetamidase/formamidase family protein [Woeseiaceae bacterium]|jgi:formamidase|nr:acetamidase/formamidase family protein [Woeseiaceae bacterium]
MSIFRGILIVLTFHVSSALADVEIGGTGLDCADDPACINRMHPDIPMAARAAPGERIIMRGRDAEDMHLDPDDFSVAETGPVDQFGVVHPMVGPVYIEGAVAGDVLAVTIESIDPGPVGYTSASSFGFAGDAVGSEDRFVVWRLNDEYAKTDAIPGVRIPNASFPGVMATMPGQDLLAAVLDREALLAEAGGAVFTPDVDMAQPSSLCGEEGSQPGQCLRTIPPRENGGNMDIRYLKAGVTVYLPCQIDGCGLAIGDFHYAQGDGEVSGTAIEMDADITVTTRIVRNGPDLSHGPHYEGPASLLNIPSSSFYATTGYPLKAAGEIPRDIAYLANAKVAALPNLSKDLNLAAQNALVAMIDYITSRYGYDRTQAYIIASVAVDLRIAQLVDVPNVGVTALLPLDIFVD